MDAEFWQERWRDGRIGFHQERSTPLLQKCWPAGSQVIRDDQSVVICC